MREFTVRRGLYAGTHKIYDSIKEAIKEGRKDIIAPWYGDNVKTGSWVVSDDGYVIQCLKRDMLVNPRHKSGQYTDIFRFCNGTFSVYYDRIGEKRITNFYGVAAKSQKSTIGSGVSEGVYMNTRKKLFCTLAAQGESLEQAYIAAFKPRYWSKGSLYYKINKLLSDPRVREEMMENFKPFKEKIEAKIAEKTGHKTLSDFVIDKLTELVTNEEVSHKDLRADIVLMMQLFGDSMGISLNNQTKTKREIQDAEFSLINPPQLGGESVSITNSISFSNSRDSSRQLSYSWEWDNTKACIY